MLVDFQCAAKPYHAVNMQRLSHDLKVCGACRCVDIPKIAELCHAKNTPICIDGTFATPINQRAIDLGADLVLHSGTKYLAGHNDVLAGALCGKSDLVAQVRAMHNVLGGTLDPDEDSRS